MRSAFKFSRGLHRWFAQTSTVSDAFIKKVMEADKQIPKEKSSTTEKLVQRRENLNTMEKVNFKEVQQTQTVEDPREESEKKNSKDKINKYQMINFEPIKIVSERDSLIETQYGVLRIPDKFKLSTLTNIYYLVNSSNINFVMSVLRKDKISLLLFPPVTSSN